MAESVVREGETGRAIISSTGTPVDEILNAIRSGGSVESAQSIHPALTREAVEAALRFAEIAVQREPRYTPNPNAGVFTLRERALRPYGASAGGSATVEPVDHGVADEVRTAVQQARRDRERLLYELDLIDSIGEGLEQIANGEGIPHEEVFARLEARYPA